LALFINTGCTQCHAGKGIGGGQLQKFGVYGGSYTQFTKSAKHDPGRKEVTGSPSDEDVFKVPTLRNVAKTAPYFHDGSVSNLNDAIRIMAKTQLNKELSDTEVQKIEVFLNALTGEVPKAAL
jgi:cytochrome c peroxidase